MSSSTFWGAGSSRQTEEAAEAAAAAAIAAANANVQLGPLLAALGPQSADLTLQIYDGLDTSGLYSALASVAVVRGVDDLEGGDASSRPTAALPRAVLAMPPLPGGARGDVPRPSAMPINARSDAGISWVHEMRLRVAQGTCLRLIGELRLGLLPPVGAAAAAATAAATKAASKSASLRNSRASSRPTALRGAVAAMPGTPLSSITDRSEELEGAATPTSTEGGGWEGGSSRPQSRERGAAFRHPRARLPDGERSMGGASSPLTGGGAQSAAATRRAALGTDFGGKGEEEEVGAPIGAEEAALLGGDGGVGSSGSLESGAGWVVGLGAAAQLRPISRGGESTRSSATAVTMRSSSPTLPRNPGLGPNAALSQGTRLVHRYLKGLLPGPTPWDLGRMLPFSAWETLPLAPPPLRPDSFGGFASVSFRPLPPYLLTRLYQKAPLNPSPAFRVRLLEDITHEAFSTFGERILLGGNGAHAEAAVAAATGASAGEEPPSPSAPRPRGPKARAPVAEELLPLTRGEWDPKLRMLRLFPKGLPDGAVFAVGHGGVTAMRHLDRGIAAAVGGGGSSSSIMSFPGSSILDGDGGGSSHSISNSLVLSVGNPSLMEENIPPPPVVTRVVTEYAEVDAGPAADLAVWGGTVRLLTDSSLLMTTAALRHVAALARPWKDYGAPVMAGKRLENPEPPTGRDDPPIPEDLDTFMAPKPVDVRARITLQPGLHMWELPRRRYSFPSLQWRRRQYWDPREEAALLVGGDPGAVPPPRIARLFPLVGDLARPWPPHGSHLLGSGIRELSSLVTHVGAGTEGGAAPGRLVGPLPTNPTGTHRDAFGRAHDVRVLQTGPSTSTVGMGPVAAVRGVALGGAGGLGAGYGDSGDVFTPAGHLAQAPGSLSVDASFLSALDEHWVHSPWELAWHLSDVEGITPHRPGLSICGCGCNKPWGSHSAFPPYEGAGWLRGSDATRYAGSAAHVMRLVKTRTTSMLLQDPGFAFGTPNLIADLSAWAIDSAAVAVLAAEAAKVPIRVLRLSSWQGPLASSQHLIALWHSMPQLRHAHIPGCDALDDLTCGALASAACAKNLLSLDLSFSSTLTDDGLIILAKACTKLRSLHVASCPRITNEGVASAGRLLRSLETLDVSYSLKVTEEGVASLLTDAGNLARVGLHGLGRGYRATVPAGGMRSESPSKGSKRPAMPSGVPVLEAGVVGPGLAGKPFMLGRVMGARVELLCRLREVDLEACVGVSDVVIIMLARNSEGALRRLKLNHCTALTAASTTAISMFCPDLQELHLAGCTGLSSPLVDSEIAATIVVQSSRDRSAGLIPDPSATFGAGWGIGKRLRELEVEGPRASVPPPWDLPPGAATTKRIVPSHVHYDAQTAPRPKWTALQLVDLTGVVGVWEADLVALFFECSDMREVRFSGCHNVTDALLPVLLSRAPMLRTLRLQSLPALTDVGIEAIASECPDLIALDVSQCTGFTGRALVSLAQRCPALEELRINDISESSLDCHTILSIAITCRKLRIFEAARTAIKGIVPAGVRGPVGSSAFAPSTGVSDKEPPVKLPPASGFCAPLVVTTPLYGADTSFKGDLYEFLLCVGMALPYCEQLDLTGSVPIGMGAVIPGGSADDVAAALEHAATTINAMGGDEFAACEPIRISLATGGGGAGGVASLGGSSRKAAQRARGAPSERTIKGGNPLMEHIDAVFPRLQRLVLRRCGAFAPFQLQAFVAMAPSLISLDVTDCACVTPATLAAALVTAGGHGAFVRLVARGVPGSEAIEASAASTVSRIGTALGRPMTAVAAQAHVSHVMPSRLVTGEIDLDLQRPLFAPRPFTGGNRSSAPHTPALPVGALLDAAMHIERPGSSLVGISRPVSRGSFATPSRNRRVRGGAFPPLSVNATPAAATAALMGMSPPSSPGRESWAPLPSRGGVLGANARALVLGDTSSRPATAAWEPSSRPATSLGAVGVGGLPLRPLSPPFATTITYDGGLGGEGAADHDYSHGSEDGHGGSGGNPYAIVGHSGVFASEREEVAVKASLVPGLPDFIEPGSQLAVVLRAADPATLAAMGPADALLASSLLLPLSLLQPLPAIPPQASDGELADAAHQVLAARDALLSPRQQQQQEMLQSPPTTVLRLLESAAHALAAGPPQQACAADGDAAILAATQLPTLDAGFERDERALGFDPLPGACFTREARVIWFRMAVERQAAERICKLILHGLRKRVEWFWTMRWRIRVLVEARRQRAARRIGVAWRAFYAYKQWKLKRSATVIQAFWRKLMRIDAVRRKFLAALQSMRTARSKQLAAALLRRIYEGIALRRAFAKMRLVALMERWHDERRINRLRGLLPVYDPAGKKKVQFVFPVAGDQILGAESIVAEVETALTIIKRANATRQLKELQIMPAPGVGPSTLVGTGFQYVLAEMGQSNKLPPSKSGKGGDTSRPGTTRVGTAGPPGTAQPTTAEGSGAAELFSGGEMPSAPMVDAYEYAFVYRFEGLALAAPKRVRRRKEWRAERLERLRQKFAAREERAAARDAELSRRGGLPLGSSLIKNAPPSTSTSLILLKPKRHAGGIRSTMLSAEDVPWLGPRMRPDRPRRNSFDLVQLSRLDPDEQEGVRVHATASAGGAATAANSLGASASSVGVPGASASMLSAAIAAVDDDEDGYSSDGWETVASVDATDVGFVDGIAPPAARSSGFTGGGTAIAAQRAPAGSSENSDVFGSADAPHVVIFGGVPARNESSYLDEDEDEFDDGAGDADDEAAQGASSLPPPHRLEEDLDGDDAMFRSSSSVPMAAASRVQTGSRMASSRMGTAPAPRPGSVLLPRSAADTIRAPRAELQQHASAIASAIYGTDAHEVVSRAPQTLLSTPSSSPHTAGVPSRPVTTHTRRTARTRDVYLRKLARLHILLLQRRGEQELAEDTLAATIARPPTVNNSSRPVSAASSFVGADAEEDVAMSARAQEAAAAERAARIEYERRHGPGSALALSLQQQIDANSRDRATDAIAAQQAISDVKEEITATTRALLAFEARLAVAKRARGRRTAAVADVNAAPHGLLAIDHGSATWRLANDAIPRIEAHYGPPAIMGVTSGVLGFVVSNTKEALVALADGHDSELRSGEGLDPLLRLRARDALERLARSNEEHNHVVQAELAPNGDAYFASRPNGTAEQAAALATDPRDKFALLAPSDPNAPVGLRPAAALAVGSHVSRGQSLTSKKQIPLKHSAYAIPPGEVRIELANPEGLNGTATALFGTGPIKRTILAAVLGSMGIDLDVAGSGLGASSGAGGLLGPLTHMVRPLESMASQLAPVGLIAASKRRLPTELARYASEKASIARALNELRTSAIRFLRNGLASRIQRWYCTRLVRRLTLQKLRDAEAEQSKIALEIARRKGRAEDEFVATVSVRQYAAAVALQTCYRRFSARLWYMRARRAAAAERAKEQLRQIGLALNLQNSAEGAAEFVRAHALLANVHASLSEELGLGQMLAVRYPHRPPPPAPPVLQPGIQVSTVALLAVVNHHLASPAPALMDASRNDDTASVMSGTIAGTITDRAPVSGRMDSTDALPLPELRVMGGNDESEALSLLAMLKAVTDAGVSATESVSADSKYAMYGAVFDAGLAIPDASFLESHKLGRGVTETLLRSRRVRLSNDQTDPLRTAYKALATALGLEVAFTSRAPQARSARSLTARHSMLPTQESSTSGPGGYYSRFAPLVDPSNDVLSSIDNNVALDMALGVAGESGGYLQGDTSLVAGLKDDAKAEAARLAARQRGDISFPRAAVLSPPPSGGRRVLIHHPVDDLLDEHGVPLSLADMEQRERMRAHKEFEDSRRRRYYQGALPLDELVAYRRRLSEAMFRATSNLQHVRCVTLEERMHRFVSETLPVTISSVVTRMGALSSGGRTWSSHWHAVLRVMETQYEQLSELSDPLLFLSRQRLKFRMHLLRQRLNTEETIIAAYDDVSRIAQRSHSWGARISANIIRRADEDRAFVQRLNDQLPDASRVLEFLVKRRAQLKRAYDTFRTGLTAARSRAAWRSAEIMRSVIADRDEELADLEGVPMSTRRSTVSKGTVSSLKGGRKASMKNIVAAEASQRRVNIASDEESGAPPILDSKGLPLRLEWADPGEGAVVSFKGPIVEGSVEAALLESERAIERDPNFYDWRRTDEWVMRADPLEQQPFVYVHVPTLVTYREEPTAPPLGYSFPPRFRKRDLLSPSVLPTAIGSDVPPPLPILSPALVPSALNNPVASAAASHLPVEGGDNGLPAPVAIPPLWQTKPPVNGDDADIDESATQVKESAAARKRRKEHAARIEKQMVRRKRRGVIRRKAKARAAIRQAAVEAAAQIAAQEAAPSLLGKLFGAKPDPEHVAILQREIAERLYLEMRAEEDANGSHVIDAHVDGEDEDGNGTPDSFTSGEEYTSGDEKDDNNSAIGSEDRRERRVKRQRNRKSRPKRDNVYGEEEVVEDDFTTEGGGGGRRGGRPANFDADEVASELRWLESEEKEVRLGILRMEGYAAASHQQALTRAQSEARNADELHRTLVELDALTLNIRRTERELLQVSAEVAAHEYFTNNGEVIHRFVEQRAASAPRFGLLPSNYSATRGVPKESLLTSLPIVEARFAPRKPSKKSKKKRKHVAPDILAERAAVDSDDEEAMAELAAIAAAEAEEENSGDSSSASASSRVFSSQSLRSIPSNSRFSRSMGAISLRQLPGGATDPTSALVATSVPLASRPARSSQSTAFSGGPKLVRQASHNLISTPSALRHDVHLVRWRKQGRVRRKSDVERRAAMAAAVAAYKASRVDLWTNARNGILHFASPLRATLEPLARAGGVTVTSDVEGGGGSDVSAGRAPASAIAFIGATKNRAAKRRAILAAAATQNRGASGSGLPAASPMTSTGGVVPIMSFSDHDGDDSVGHLPLRMEAGKAAVLASPPKRGATLPSAPPLKHAAGDTHILPGGGTAIGGFSYGTARGGRFGRYIKAASEIAADLQKRDDEDRTARFLRLAQMDEERRLARAAAGHSGISGDLAETLDDDGTEGGDVGRNSPLAAVISALDEAAAPERAARERASRASLLRTKRSVSPVGAPTVPAPPAADAPSSLLAGWVIPAFRFAEARPTMENVRYYSISGDGEEIGNSGFWYWGYDSGTTVGLFGIRMHLGVPTTQTHLLPPRPGRQRRRSSVEDAPSAARAKRIARRERFVPHANLAALNANAVRDPDTVSEGAVSSSESDRGLLEVSHEHAHERARTGNPEHRALGRELAKLQKVARANAKVARRERAAVAKVAERAAAASAAAASAAAAAASKKSWFGFGTKNEQIATDARDMAYASVGSELHRTAYHAINPQVESHATRIAAGVYPHLSETHVADGALPSSGLGHNDLTGLTTTRRDDDEFREAHAAVQTHARRSHKTVRGVLGTVIAAVMPRTRRRVPVPAKNVLGPEINDAVHDLGADTIHRRTGVGGADNMNALIGWEAKKVPPHPMDDAEQDGVERVPARRLAIEGDSYARTPRALAHRNVIPSAAAAAASAGGASPKMAKAVDIEQQALDLGVAKGWATLAAVANVPVIPVAPLVAGAAPVAGAPLSAAVGATGPFPYSHSPISAWSGGPAALPLNAARDATERASAAQLEATMRGGGNGVEGGTSSRPVGGNAKEGDSSDQEPVDPFAAATAAVEAIAPAALGLAGRKAERDAIDSPAWWAAISPVPDFEARLLAAELSKVAAAAERARVLRETPFNARPTRRQQWESERSGRALSEAGAEIEATMRGFGGGSVVAGGNAEYAMRLMLQENKLRGDAKALQLRKAICLVRLDSIMASMETSSEKMLEVDPPLVLATSRKLSTAATDEPFLVVWEAAREARALQRKAAKEKAERDKRRRVGISELDEAHMAAEKERDKEESRAKRMSRGLPPDDPDVVEAALREEAAAWVEYRKIHPGEEFVSRGLQGIVAADGSLLEWAGTGAEFNLPKWKARYRTKPWIADLSYLRYLAAKSGQSFKSPEDMYALIMEQGGAAAIRSFKVHGMPKHGLEAVKAGLDGEREVLKAEIAAKEAAKKASKEADLRKIIGARKDKSVSSMLAEEEAARNAAATIAAAETAALDKATADAAAEAVAAATAATKMSAADALKAAAARLDPRLLGEVVSGALHAARNLYYNYQRDMAEQRVTNNVELQMAVGKVKVRLEAAKGVLEGIASFHFTAGVFETAKWATAQRVAFEKQQPYFVSLPLDLGLPGEPAYLWYQRTRDELAMVSNMIWAPFDAAEDPIVNMLHKKNYKYVTHPALFKGFGLWYVCGTGPPVTALTVTYDSPSSKFTAARGFRQLDGVCNSAAFNPEATLWYRLGRLRRKVYKPVSETLRESETAALKAVVDSLQAQVDAATAEIDRRKTGFGKQLLVNSAASKAAGVELASLVEGLTNAKRDLEECKVVQLAEHEAHMAESAIDFLGMRGVDVRDLSRAFYSMDPSWEARNKAMLQAGLTPPPLRVTLSQFYKAIDVQRSPITDSLFVFMDPLFVDDIAFSTFLRAAVTFCMFGAQEIVTWVFTAVASNVIGTAEEQCSIVPPPGRAGMRGIDRQSRKSIYWPDAVSWQSLREEEVGTGDTLQDRISLKAFNNLLYTLHAPSSVLAVTVKRAIINASAGAVGGGLRLFQFRQIVTDFPTLLSPVFLLQTSMRNKLLGEAWWADKRQIFKDARDLVSQEMSLDQRFKLLAKQAATARRRKLDRAAARKGSRAVTTGGAGGSDDESTGTGTGTDADTDAGAGSKTGGGASGTTPGTSASRSKTGTAAHKFGTRTDAAPSGAGTGLGTRTDADGGGAYGGKRANAAASARSATGAGPTQTQA